jgi:hypothetical protein
MPSASSEYQAAGCIMLRKKAVEYRRLSKLAADITIAEQLSVFAEKYMTLAIELSDPQHSRSDG